MSRDLEGKMVVVKKTKDLTEFHQVKGHPMQEDGLLGMVVHGPHEECPFLLVHRKDNKLFNPKDPMPSLDEIGSFQTSAVVKVVESTPEHVVFQTQNSEYEATFLATAQA